VENLLKRHKEEHGPESAIFKYHFLDERSPEFYLVAIAEAGMRYEEVKLLTSIKGIGVYSALVIY